MSYFLFVWFKLMDFSEGEEDKVCPWEYGAKNEEDDASIIDEDRWDYALDEVDSASEWSEGEVNTFPIAENLKRPGRNRFKYLQNFKLI